MTLLNNLIEHFGYLGIMVALIGGIIGLPIPDEVLLAYVGYHVFQGQMDFYSALLCAFTGASVGISISYLLGVKLGQPFLKKFGPKFHMTEERVNRTKKLFNKWGPIFLFVGFFIPGVRHITAYLSGINSYSFKRFAFFTYLGALTWSFTFISLGISLGQNWNEVEVYVSKYSTVGILAVILTVLYIFISKKIKREPKNSFNIK